MIPPSRSKDMLDCIQQQVVKQVKGESTKDYTLDGFTLSQLVEIANFIASFASTNSEYDDALCSQSDEIYRLVYPDDSGPRSQQPNPSN